MEKHKVLSKEELESRYEIYLENYIKEIHIEALTLCEMVRKDISYSIVNYSRIVAQDAAGKLKVDNTLKCTYEKDILKRLDAAEDGICSAMDQLDADIKKAEALSDPLETARFYRDVILEDMNKVRGFVDAAELIIPNEYVNYPTYEEMLFSLR
jgi:glutamine synthetase